MVSIEIAGLILFALALVTAAGSPGPSIAALVARVLTNGWRDVAPFLAAMWIGEWLWLTAAIAGLAAIADVYQFAFAILKYCGVAYLLYLAWHMWVAPVSTGDDTSIPRSGSGWRMFAAGMAVTLGNPKIMVFYLALLPAIVPIERVGAIDWLALSATMFIVLVAVDFAYVVLAARTRRLLRRPGSVRIMNRLGATAMGGAAIAVATR